MYRRIHSFGQSGFFYPGRSQLYGFTTGQNAGKGLVAYRPSILSCRRYDPVPGFSGRCGYHRPSPYSRFVYVDLVNRRDSVLKKVKLALIDSVFAGYLKVPEDIRQGEYFLRSYSYWMQNLGEDYIYKKRIHLINPSDSKVLTGVTYQEEQGEKYAVVRLSNSRKELTGSWLSIIS